MKRFPQMSAHVVALGTFAGITVIWLWALLSSPATRIPGTGAGDNFVFVWDLWWTRHAVQSHAWPLWCPALFVPFGIDLTLNTHALLPTLVIALLSSTGSVLIGTNAIICAHIFLNFAVTYAFALRMTRSVTAALCGALLFGWCPYVEVRLLGHFNLIAAWTLPLAALLTVEMLERRSTGSALFLALSIAVTTYTDYYYAVYAVTLAFVLACCRFTRVTWGIRAGGGRYHRRVLVAVSVTVAILCIIGATIWLSGGLIFAAGRLAISMKSPHNPLAAASLLVMLSATVSLALGSTVEVAWDDVRRALPVLSVAILVAVVLLLPLLISGFHLWLRGDYISQTYLWRSAPPGIDAGTLLLGNPRGLLWDGSAILMYRHFGITEIEQTAWLSPGLLCLCGVALRRRSESPGIRVWIAVAAVFGAWALGPYLVAFGRTLPIMLPATLVRYVPVVSNARIPSRAIVVVYLAGAMLGAHGFLLLRQNGRSVWATMCAALAVADLVPARPPIVSVDRPPIYETLRAHPQTGAVCELPLGLRDGFGEVGRFDSRVLWYQTIHDRGLVGGFVARMPKRMVPAYEAAPVLGSFLRLSAGHPLDEEVRLSPAQAADALIAQGVRFIVLNRRMSPADLVTYVERLGLRRIARDDERDLLIVERPGS